MPELPEVQTVVDILNTAGLSGKRIEYTAVYWPKTIATCTPEAFGQTLTGKTVSGIRRRGKYIIIGLIPECYLIIHLRMTGRLALSDRMVKNPHVHVVLRFDDGRHLIFHDTRKFGRFYLTAAADTIIGALGPEPLGPEFTGRYLYQQLNRRQRMIKPLLLDQTFLAGLGNIYVDEALWTASIHPLRSSNSLSREETRSLHRAIRSVLRQGVRNSGTSLGDGKGNFVSPNNDQGRNVDQLKVFRRTGQACRRCGHAIERIVVGQRSTHICANCQMV